MERLTLPRRAAAAGAAALVAAGLLPGPARASALPPGWLDRYFPHQPGRPGLFRPSDELIESAPMEVRALASLLCSATWREPAGANLYDADPDFRHDWERAGWLLARWCRAEVEMPANMAAMRDRTAGRGVRPAGPVYVPTDREADRVPATVGAAAAMMSSVAWCNHPGESAYETDPAFEAEWERCGAFSLRFVELRGRRA